jgi:hypothetical protein
MKLMINSFLSLLVLLVAMLGTPMLAQAQTAPTTAPAMIDVPKIIEAAVSPTDDAARYASREVKAQTQADFKGGDGVIIGITATSSAVILLILLIILL